MIKKILYILSTPFLLALVVIGTSLHEIWLARERKRWKGDFT